MAFRRKEPDPDPETGLKEEFRAFLAETSTHLRSRGELLGIEAKEAASSYSRKLTLAACGFGTLAVGYLLLMVAFTGLLGSLFSGSGLSLANWTGAALLIGATHLLIAFATLRKARKIGKDAALFEYTLAELRKDQQWLNREEQLIRELHAQREDLTDRFQSLKAGLEPGRRLRLSLRKHPLRWTLGAAGSAFLAARLFRSKTIIQNTRKKRRGLLFQAVKVAFFFARPALTALAVQKAQDHLQNHLNSRFGNSMLGGPPQK